MASTSVDGLISGLDTTNLVNQLVQLERQPQLRLVAQQKALESTTSVYKTLNTRFDAILQAAKSLATPTDWQAMKATTGDASRLTASASPTPPAGNLTVSVEPPPPAPTNVPLVPLTTPAPTRP